MPIWSANDDPTGRPNYANTSDVYGVDKAEAAVAASGVAPGWVRVTPQTGYVSFLTVVAGGSRYTNSDVVTVDGVSTSGVVNATANVVVGFSANVSGNAAVTSGQVNLVSTGYNLTTGFANGYEVFVYTNSTSAAVRTINQVVNSTFMNVTSSWPATNASAAFGVSGVILRTDYLNEGSGFTTQKNVSITTVAGAGANVTATLGGRAGRTQYENLVYVANVQNDDSDDTVFPDT